MKTVKSESKRNGETVENLIARATTAKKLLDAARKHLKIVKAEHKLARRALKQAKKAARRARKQAKKAVKLQAPRNGVKLPKTHLKPSAQRRPVHRASAPKGTAHTKSVPAMPLTSPEDKVVTE